MIYILVHRVNKNNFSLHFFFFFQLTHDLDQVEVLIAEQVAQKSDAFFQAMTSHDSLMEQLTKTLSVVKSLRQEISVIDNCWVKKSLRILQLKRQQQNALYVLQKVGFLRGIFSGFKIDLLMLKYRVN